jgi:hypothetical protein
LHQASEANIAASEGVLRQHVRTPPGQEDYLLDKDVWIDLLKPPNPSGPPNLLASRTAVAALTTLAGGYTAAHLKVWTARLADPTILAQHLATRQAVYETTFHWLYVTRNLAFHNGQFAAATDVLSAHAGQALVDLTLEFLGNWRTLEHALGRPAAPAPDVYVRLARRYDDLLSRLNQPGSTCHPLQVDHITGPDEHWWM